MAGDRKLQSRYEEVLNQEEIVWWSQSKGCWAGPVTTLTLGRDEPDKIKCMGFQVPM